MKKNKKLPISPVACVLLLWGVVLAVYAVTYALPMLSNVSLLSSNLMLKQAEVAMYERYLDDASPLEAEIAALEEEIDKVNDSFINDANVSFKISEAIQRFDVSLASVSLDTVTSYNGMHALPINLVLHGTMENILDFVEYFERNEDGSFVVRSMNLDVNAYSTDASIRLYLCTPSV